MLKQAIKNYLEINKKIEKLSKEKEVIKKEPNGNYKAEKYNH